MSLSELFDIGKVLVAVVSLALFFFFYFRNQGFQNVVSKVLKFLPSLLPVAASYVEDKKGVFDGHDALVLLGRVAEKIRSTITDPANKSFEDVQDEVFEIVRSELANYANLPGVPDLDDPAVQVQIRAVFESIQRAVSEDSA